MAKQTGIKAWLQLTHQPQGFQPEKHTYKALQAPAKQLVTYSSNLKKKQTSNSNI